MAGKRWRKQWDLTEESVQIFYLNNFTTQGQRQDEGKLTQYSIPPNVGYSNSADRMLC